MKVLLVSILTVLSLCRGMSQILAPFVSYIVASPVATITHIQTNKASASGKASATLNSVVVGNLIVVSCLTSPDSRITNASDGSNTFYAGAPESGAGSGGFSIAHYFTVATTGGNLTFTMVGAAPSYSTMIVSEYYSTTGWPSGSGAFDKSHIATQASPGTGADGIQTGATPTRSQAIELLVGGFVISTSTNDSYSAGTNFIIPINGKEETGTLNICGATEHQIVSIAGTDQATFTTGTNGYTFSLISTFKPN